MNISAKYNEDGSISAVIGALSVSVPDNDENRHRKMIAKWEAGGNLITPFVADTTIYPDMVKAECLRRMLIAFSANDQDHLSQKISESIQIGLGLFDKGKENWNAGDHATAAYLRNARSLEKDFDVKSKALRAMSPIPDDYEDNKYWPSNV